MGLQEGLLDFDFQIGWQAVQVSHWRSRDQVRLEDHAEIVFLDHALGDHAHEFRVFFVVPPVRGGVHSALIQGHHGIHMAAGVNHFAEIVVWVDAHFVQGETWHHVARCGVGVDQTEVFALQVFDLVVGRVGFHIHHCVVTAHATFGCFGDKGGDVGTGHAGTGVSGRAVVTNVNLTGTLAFNHGSVVSGHTQGHFHACFFGQVFQKVFVTVGHHGGVFSGDNGEHQLFGSGGLGLSARGEHCSSNGDQVATVQHGKSFK